MNSATRKIIWINYLSSFILSKTTTLKSILLSLHHLLYCFLPLWSAGLLPCSLSFSLPLRKWLLVSFEVVLLIFLCLCHFFLCLHSLAVIHKIYPKNCQIAILMPEGKSNLSFNCLLWWYSIVKDSTSISEVKSSTFYQTIDDDIQ